eukprot:TRINITY_DN9883_c0_g1_i1.p1 TRINITY_DN9883_c0_g1~~TRINITY_DN9883_c0_g1_i1.p1  ORF type:complete len:783 (+),score=181.63 TRINITY_DN9883_c0_g1_i1:62-2350(+)
MEWPISSTHPRGKVSHNLGAESSIETQKAAILQQNEIFWTEDFPASCMNQVAKLEKEYAALNIDGGKFDENTPGTEKIFADGRTDLRDLLVFTIDPPSSRDLDDAISVKFLPDGLVEIGVHIADASHFMPSGTPLDVEANKRATTVYLVETNIPMIPRVLSENVCSLLPGRSRLTFSVIWTIDPANPTTIVKEWMGKTLITSACRLAYGVAQRILNGDPASSFTCLASKDVDVGVDTEAAQTAVLMAEPERREEILPQVCKALLTTVAITREYRRQREVVGNAFSLDCPAPFVVLDPETHVPIDIKFGGAGEGEDEKKKKAAEEETETDNAHEFIEDLMLLANRRVGKRLLEHVRKLKGTAMLRNHGVPKQDKLNEIQQFCANKGIVVDFSAPENIAPELRRILTTMPENIQHCILNMLKRPMVTAQYIAVQNETKDAELRHFALDLDVYTHFTSPIRRYADVIVHHQLAAILQGKKPKGLSSFTKLQKITEHVSDRKKKADSAQDDFTQLYINWFYNLEENRSKVKPLLGVVCEFIRDRNVVVFIPALDDDVKIDVKDIPLVEKHSWDASKQVHSLTFKDGSNLELAAFTEVMIVPAADWDRRGLKFRALLQIPGAPEDVESVIELYDNKRKKYMQGKPNERSKEQKGKPSQKKGKATSNAKPKKILTKSGHRGKNPMKSIKEKQTKKTKAVRTPKKPAATKGKRPKKVANKESFFDLESDDDDDGEEQIVIRKRTRPKQSTAQKTKKDPASNEESDDSDV